MKKRSADDNPTDLQRYWYYSRIFKGTIFPELFFTANQYASKIFGIILDKIQNSESGYDRQGSVYLDLVGQYYKTPKASLADFISTEEMYNDLTSKFVLIISSAEGRVQLERIRAQLAQIRSAKASAATALSENAQADLPEI